MELGRILRRLGMAAIVAALCHRRTLGAPLRRLRLRLRLRADGRDSPRRPSDEPVALHRMSVALSDTSCAGAPGSRATFRRSATGSGVGALRSAHGRQSGFGLPAESLAPIMSRILSAAS